jgi:hypothetical protein
MLTDNRGKVAGMETYKLGSLLDTVEQLAKIGKALHHRYEMACNGEIDAEDMNEDGDDLIAAKLQKKADKIGANVGLYVYHQTDPRGWPLYVSFNPIPGTDYYRAAAAINCHLSDDDDEESNEE